MKWFKFIFAFVFIIVSKLEAKENIIVDFGVKNIYITKSCDLEVELINNKNFIDLVKWNEIKQNTQLVITLDGNLTQNINFNKIEGIDKLNSSTKHIFYKTNLKISKYSEVAVVIKYIDDSIKDTQVDNNILSKYLSCAKKSKKANVINVENGSSKWKFTTKFIGTPINWITEYHCIKNPKEYFSVSHLWNRDCKLVWKKQNNKKGKWKELCTDDEGREFNVFGYVSYYGKKVVITKKYKISHQPFKEYVIAKYLSKCKINKK